MPNSAQPNDLFDPGIQENQPENFLGYSRGFDTVGEAIGKGIGQVGDLFATVTKGVDSVLGTQAKEAVEAAVDPIQAQAIQSYSMNKELPDPLGRKITRLGTAQEAMNQGRLTESHYWAMLDVEARKLRAQYPGYRDQIDAEFHKMTGAIPANQLIRDLRGEMNRGNTQEHTDLMNEWHHARDTLGTPEILGLVARGISPEQIGLQQIRAWNAAQAAKLAQIKREEQTLTLDAARDAHDTRKWQKVGQLALSTELDNRLTTAQVALTGKISELREKAGVASDQPLPAEQTQQLIAWYNTNVRQPYLQARNDFWYSRKLKLEDGSFTTYAQNVKDADRKAIFDAQDAHLQGIEDAITNNNFGYLHLNQTMNKLSEEGAYGKALKDEVNLNVVTGRKIYGEQGFAALLNLPMTGEAAKNLNNIEKAFNNLFKVKAVLPDNNLNKTIENTKKGAKDAGLTEGQTNKLALDAHTETILRTELPATMRAEAAKNLFKDPSFYAKADGQAQDKLWAKLTHPGMTKAIEEIAKQGDPAVQEYYNKALQQMFGLRVGQTGVGILRLKTTPSEYGMVYDPQTFTFSVQKTIEGVQWPEGSAPIDIRPELTGLATQANSSVQNFAAARKAQGATPDQINADIQNFFLVKGGIDINNMAYQPPGGSAQDREEQELMKRESRGGSAREKSQSPGQPFITGPQVTPPRSYGTPGKEFPLKSEERAPQERVPQPQKLHEGIPAPEPKPVPGKQGTLTPEDMMATNPTRGEYVHILKTPDGKFQIAPNYKSGTGTDKKVPITPEELSEILNNPKNIYYPFRYESLEHAQKVMAIVEREWKKKTKAPAPNS